MKVFHTCTPLNLPICYVLAEIGDFFLQFKRPRTGLPAKKIEGLERVTADIPLLEMTENPSFQTQLREVHILRRLVEAFQYFYF